MEGLILDRHGPAPPRRQAARASRSSTTGSTGTARESYSLIGSATRNILDAPWVEDGKFVRQVARASEHPLAAVMRGGAAQWPQVITTRGTLGRAARGPTSSTRSSRRSRTRGRHSCSSAVTIFCPDGTAMLCTIQGDVWHVSGLDEKLEQVRWRRYASGLHQALGLVVSDGKVYVLGRDQITCLHDSNGDGEADFYECSSNAYATSTAGHDFICGLERDRPGRFYTASSKFGVLRIAADGARSKLWRLASAIPTVWDWLLMAR